MRALGNFSSPSFFYCCVVSLAFGLVLNAEDSNYHIFSCLSWSITAISCLADACNVLSRGGTRSSSLFSFLPGSSLITLDRGT